MSAACVVPVCAAVGGHGGGFDDDDLVCAAGSRDAAAVCDAGPGWADDSRLVTVGDGGEVADGLEYEFLVGLGCAGTVDDGPDGPEGMGCRRRCGPGLGFGHEGIRTGMIRCLGDFGSLVSSPARENRNGFGAVV